VSYLPLGIALGTLQKLHRRSGGSAVNVEGIDRLTQPQAFSALSRGIAAVLGQVAVLEPTSANQMLKIVCQTAADNGLAGLHPIYFAAFLSARRLGETPELSEAVAIWNDTGLPRELPGRALTTPLLNIDTRRLSLVDGASIAAAIGPERQNYTTLSTGFLALDQRGEPGVDVFLTGLVRIGQAIVDAADAVAGTALASRPPSARDELLPAGTESLPSAPSGPATARARLVKLLAEGSAAVVDLSYLDDTNHDVQEPESDSGLTLSPRFSNASNPRPEDGVWRAKQVSSWVVKPPESGAHLLAQGGSLVLQGLTELRRNGSLSAGGLITSFQPSGSTDLGEGSVGRITLGPHAHVIPGGPVVDPLTGELVHPITHQPINPNPQPDRNLAVALFVEEERQRLGLPNSATVGDVVQEWNREADSMLNIDLTGG
jgi:hypothetical protein